MQHWNNSASFIIPPVVHAERLCSFQPKQTSAELILSPDLNGHAPPDMLAGCLECILAVACFDGSLVQFATLAGSSAGVLLQKLASCQKEQLSASHCPFWSCWGLAWHRAR